MNKFAPRFLLGFCIGLATFVGAVGITACHQATQAASAPDNSGPDPADANMAPVDNSQPQPAGGGVSGVSAPAPAQPSEATAMQEMH